jgi:hypothetical protein
MKNSAGLFKANRLNDPEPPPGYRTAPLDPGVNIARRPFTWIGPIVITVVLITSGANSNASSSGGSNAAYRWEVGNCVSFGEAVVPLSCNSSHSGKITAAVFLLENCPIGTDSYVNVDGKFYCIDENQ